MVGHLLAVGQSGHAVPTVLWRPRLEERPPVVLFGHGGARWHRGPAPERGPGRRGAGVSWNSANTAVLAEGKRFLIGDPSGWTQSGTLTRRVTVLAYFDRPGTSNSPTEGINVRLEHLGAQPSGSATWPNTSPYHYARPADSDPNYAID
jgi:hypothetical protein